MKSIINVCDSYLITYIIFYYYCFHNYSVHLMDCEKMNFAIICNEKELKYIYSVFIHRFREH